MSTLSERLKESRSDLKISQAALAKKAGCGQSSVASIENGRNQGSTLIPLLAQVLGVSPLWLATGKGAKAAGSAEPALGYGPDPIPDYLAPLVKRMIDLGEGHPALAAIDMLLSGYEGRPAPKHSRRKLNMTGTGEAKIVIKK